MPAQAHIRNFCIIAHIDHGKSTLADRLLELTATIEPRRMRDQVLDGMDLERERGITIKMHPVTMLYEHTDGVEYTLNLIDTPGHVDFTYEVSRSMAACEGALLVVDASQGIEAQTLANTYMAVEAGLAIIPVINKIDLISARPQKVAQEICKILGLPVENAIMVSAKEGTNCQQVLRAIIECIPPPAGVVDSPLRALVFDSVYDSYRGVLAYVRVVDGAVEDGAELSFMNTGSEFEVLELGIFRPQTEQRQTLATGQVGYIATGVKDIRSVPVGDTITDAKAVGKKPLHGYRQTKPVVFCGLYPVDADSYDELASAIDKLSLNDSSFHYEPETSNALGFGFRLGFLGLLHMEIVQERLEREFNLRLVTTTPNVAFKVETVRGDTLYIENPAKLPNEGDITSIAEPFIRASIVTPTEFIGDLMQLCQHRRGEYIELEYIDPERVILSYYLPLSEIMVDFYDQLKSISRGYASLDYEIAQYRPTEMVKLDILVNGDEVDALSTIVHKNKSYNTGTGLVSKLKKLIPRQLFEVVIQARAQGRIISRANIHPLRKNVTAKCYGGDITRKRKLLEKQKKGKKRMKMVGKVEIPQEAFMSVLTVGRD
jgi:GTP-binding protein LepA